MKTTKLLASVLITAFCLPVFAQPSTTGITHTERNQKDRVAQGIRTGELTNSEAHTLQGQQDVIRADKRAAMADGVVTTAERRKIKHEQARAGRAIHNKKHNAATS